MRILIAHNYYRYPGGEDHCFAEEAELLRSHGHIVDLFMLHNNEIDDLSRFRLASKTIWNSNVYAEIIKLLGTNSYDVVHVHNTLPLISPAIFYAARKMGVPSVQTLHNFRLLCANACFFRDGSICERCSSELIPYSGILFKCYRDSRVQTAGVTAMTSIHRVLGTWSSVVDAYIVLTEFARNKFVASGLNPLKIHIKPNFIDQMPEPGTGRGGYALFVGRLSQEKGIVTMLEAFKNSHSSLPLKIIGDGPLNDVVREIANQDNTIEWLGYRDKEEVRRLMQNAAVLVFPSECFESFGRVAIEAMSVGTPVIASNLGALREVVDHDRTGRLFDPGSTESLLEALNWFAVHPDRVSVMRIAARTVVEAEYGAERNYELLMGVYDAVRLSTLKAQTLGQQ
jgi:glycosyltransferase involved in cell wall biosynthesis